MSGTKVTPSADQPNCPQCGTPLPSGALTGLCPACLLKMGAQTDTVTDGQQPGFTPPAIAELAPLFPQLEILEFIGKGGMGAVYKARQKQLDRIVALKILPPGIGADPAFAERFTREARALAKLNHPGIVTLYEFGVAGSRRGNEAEVTPVVAANPPPHVGGYELYYFLMEFVDGVNLRQLLHAGRVSAREALAIVPQICDALQFAHDQGIVHRDIKPENILMDRRGRVKVADFGLAKIVGSDAPLAPSDGERVAKPGEGSPVLTDAGKVMGTPQYMAPEQRDHPGDVDHRADIYALGVVFYQMLTGELPGKKLEPPSRKVSIDVRLDEVVLRALEQKPELRYQQASVLKTQVETIASTTGSSRGDEAQAEVPPPATQAWGRINRRIARAGVMVGLGTFLLATTITFLLPDSYKATARVKVERIASIGGHPLPLEPGDDAYFLQTEIEIIQSAAVLDRVIETRNLITRWSEQYNQGRKLTTGQTRELLKHRLEIRPVRNTTLIEIGVFDELPGEAAELANAIADNLATVSQQQILSFFEKSETKQSPDRVVTAGPQIRRVSVVDHARPPTHPARPNRPLNLLVGAVLGIVLGFATFAAATFWLHLRGRTRKDERTKPEQGESHFPAGVQQETKLPPLAFPIALTFGGTMILGLLCDLLPGRASVGWLIALFLLLAGGSALETYRLRRFASAERQRACRALGAWVAFLAAIPTVAFAVFFLMAMVGESGGWNPSADEAVIVEFAWLGAVLLPVAGWRLAKGIGREIGVAVVVMVAVAGISLGVWNHSAMRLNAERDKAVAQSRRESQLRQWSLHGTTNTVFGLTIESGISPGETGLDGMSPGAKPDLNRIGDEIEQLMNAGDYEGALQRQLWYFDHALALGESDPVRLSFGISHWAELGRRYPKALQAMVEIRDRDARQLSTGSGSFPLFQEVASLNRELQEPDATLLLFRIIEARNPNLAGQAYYVVEGDLAAKGDYATCDKYLGDPQSRFEMFRQSWELRKHLQLNLPKRSLHLPSGVPAPPDLTRQADQDFIQQVRTLIEILVGTGLETAADNIQTRALAVLDVPELRSAVSDAEKKLTGTRK